MTPFEPIRLNLPIDIEKSRQRQKRQLQKLAPEPHPKKPAKPQKTQLPSKPSPVDKGSDRLGALLFPNGL